MKQTPTMLWAAAICLAGLAAGCDKKISFTYINTTSNALTARLVEHGIEKVPFPLPADSEVTQRRKYDKDFLPITYVLRAGEMQSDSFTIDEDSPGKLWFIIQPNKIIGPLKKGDRLDSGREIKTEHRRGHAVVE